MDKKTKKNDEQIGLRVSDELKQTLESALALRKKYNDLPRVGWLSNNNKSKNNQAITVSRSEVIKLIDDYLAALIGNEIKYYEVENLTHYLEQLAESNRVVCKQCLHTYSQTWMQGKCPFCEARAAAESMIKNERR